MSDETKKTQESELTQEQLDTASGGANIFVQVKNAPAGRYTGETAEDEERPKLKEDDTENRSTGSLRYTIGVNQFEN